MAFICIETSKTSGDIPNVNDYFKEVKKRLVVDDVVKNAYVGSVYKVRNGLHVVDIKCKYPPFYYVGFVWFITAFAIWGLNWWLIPPILISLSSFFYSPFYLLIMLRLGLRKHYSGRINIWIDSSRFIRRFKEWGK